MLKHTRATRMPPAHRRTCFLVLVGGSPDCCCCSSCCSCPTRPSSLQAEVWSIARTRASALCDLSYVQMGAWGHLAYIRRSRRGLFVLLILPAALALEPVLVLLAVGHGGAFEGADLLLQLLISDTRGLAQVGIAQVGPPQVGLAQVGMGLHEVTARVFIDRIGPA